MGVHRPGADVGPDGDMWSRHVRGFLLWPGGVARLCAAAVVFVALGVSAVELPKTIHRLGDDATSNARLSYSDREIAGGNSIIADQELAYEARGIIPQDASYRVVVGTKVTKQAALPVSTVPGWFQYFLMPRRVAADARWIVCYGCDPATLGAPYTILWRDDYGLSVGRLGA